MGERTGVYWAGRATLTSTPADFPAYDELFERWFGGESVPKGQRVDIQRPPVSQAPLDSGEGRGRGRRHRQRPGPRERAGGAAPPRRRDPQRGRPRRCRTDVRRASTRARRCAAPAATSGRGAARSTARRTLREQLRRMGEPGRIHHRRRGTRPRRIVLLIDVSGSMSAYADSLLRLAHVFVRTVPHVEVFTHGHAPDPRDPAAAPSATPTGRSPPPDASSPTGRAAPASASSIGAFLDRWGRRGMARGAVVVVFSDGWEREGPEMLGEQMRRLAALSHRVVWVNPHRGQGRLRSRCSRGSSRPCRTSTTSSPGTRSRRSRS